MRTHCVRVCVQNARNSKETNRYCSRAFVRERATVRAGGRAPPPSGRLEVPVVLCCTLAATRKLNERANLLRSPLVVPPKIRDETPFHRRILTNYF